MGQRTWDVDVVRDLFNTRDADLILNIPLSYSRHEDNWFWSFDNSGKFSIKILYRQM